MAKYRVSLSTVVSFNVEVDAEDEEHAIEAAYQKAPSEAYGPNPETMYALDLNEAWQLHEPEVKEITEE